MLNINKVMCFLGLQSIDYVSTVHTVYMLRHGNYSQTRICMVAVATLRQMKYSSYKYVHANIQLLLVTNLPVLLQSS